MFFFLFYFFNVVWMALPVSHFLFRHPRPSLRLRVATPSLGVPLRPKVLFTETCPEGRGTRSRENRSITARGPRVISPERSEFVAPAAGTVAVRNHLRDRKLSFSETAVRMGVKKPKNLVL
jgi:hypothetical protein